MSVATLTNRVQYAGNNVTVDFAIPLPVLESTDLVVTLTDADGVDTVQALGADYSVDLDTGELTMIVAPATDEQLTIERIVPLTQQVDLVNSGDFPSQTVEDALDKLTMFAQQNKDVLNRSIAFPATDDIALSALLPKASERAQMYLSFNADGEPVCVSSLTSFEGDWLPATEYSTPQLVKYGGNVYFCLVDHTSNVFVDDLAAGKWILVMEAVSSDAVNVRVINSQSNSYTVIASDQNKLILFTGTGPKTFSLTAAATLGSNFEFHIKNGGSGTLTVDPAGAELIDGAATVALTAGQAITVVCTGTAFLITQSRGYGAGAGTVTAITFQKGLLSTVNPLVASGTVEAAHPLNIQTGATYTILTGDKAKLVALNRSSAVAVTLPQANSAGFENDNFFFYASNINTGTVTITPTTSTIDGAATLTLAQYEGCMIFASGGQYYSVRGRPNATTVPTLGNVIMGSQDSSASGTLRNVAGMSFAVTAGKTYYFDMFIMASQGQMSFALTFPAGTMQAGVSGPGAVNTGTNYFHRSGSITASGVATSDYNEHDSTEFVARIVGTFICGTSGTVQLQNKKGGASTMKIEAGSAIRYQEV